MNRRLQKSLKKSDKKKEDRPILISGELGIPLNGRRTVEVPNRKSFVFVRLKNNTSELIQAYNSSVPPIYDLPVLVSRKGSGYTVIGRNVDRYTNQWAAAYLPKHGAQHSFNPDLNIGGDITWIYSRQFMPLLGYPSGSAGSPRLAISPYLIQDSGGNWKYVGNTGTPSTAPYNPVSGSRMILAYIDAESGNPYFLVNTGSYVDLSLTGTNQVAPYIPRTENQNQIPIAAIRLVSGTSILTWDNIYDVRPFFHVQASGSSGGGGGGGGFDGFGFVGWDEGVSLGTGTVLNVVGAGATLSRSGTVFNLEILGGGGGGGGAGVMAWDEGIPLGTGTVFNFVGGGVEATISGSVVRVAVEGVNTGTLDARYLMLDASNDPLTNSLEIISPIYAGYFKSNLGYSVLHLEQNGTSFGTEAGVDLYRIGVTGTLFQFPAFQIFDNLNLMKHSQDAGTLRHTYYTGTDAFNVVDINPWANPTGSVFFLDSQTAISVSGTFLQLQRRGREIFRINGSGTALSNGVPLIKEAPVDGQMYLRKDAGWVLSIGGAGGGSGMGVMGWDEGIPLGTGTIFNFVGAGVTATISGTVINVNIPGGGSANPPITGSVVVSEDGSILGSVLQLNFRDNIVASLSGTVAHIDVSNPSTSSGFTDDLSTYVDGIATTFLLSHTPQSNTARLYYNGIRQRFNFHYTISGAYVNTLFTPVTGSTLIADYSESGGSGGGDGDNVFAIGMAVAL